MSAAIHIEPFQAIPPHVVVIGAFVHAVHEPLLALTSLEYMRPAPTPPLPESPATHTEPFQATAVQPVIRVLGVDRVVQVIPSVLVDTFAPRPPTQTFPFHARDNSAPVNVIVSAIQLIPSDERAILCPPSPPANHNTPFHATA